MKKFIMFITCIAAVSITGIANSAVTKNKEIVAAYQELCAKEHDPVKRQNYCYMLENHGRSHTNTNIFRLDTALV